MPVTFSSEDGTSVILTSSTSVATVLARDYDKGESYVLGQNFARIKQGRGDLNSTVCPTQHNWAETADSIIRGVNVTEQTSCGNGTAAGQIVNLVQDSWAWPNGLPGGVCEKLSRVEANMMLSDATAPLRDCDHPDEWFKGAQNVESLGGWNGTARSAAPSLLSGNSYDSVAGGLLLVPVIAHYVGGGH